MKLTHWTTAFLGLTACGARASAPPHDPAPWAYTLEIDADRLISTVCFGGAPPASVIPGVADGAARARRVWHIAADGAPAAAAIVDGAVQIPPDAACVQVDYMRADVVDEAPPGALIWPGRVLWRAPDAPPADGATLRVRVPADRVVAAPWTRRADDAFELPDRAFHYRTDLWIGPTVAHRIEVGGAHLDVVRLGPPTAAGAAAEARWIETAARGVASVHGGFPVPSAMILVYVERGRGVRFGSAERGGALVRLYVGVDSTAADLARDWTATHEIFHLGLPQVHAEDAWFAEGVTTYYQEVARARAGAQTPRDAWGALHAGFGRGRWQSSGRSLGVDSAQMHRWRAYWRVYWGGAAWALEADVALRRQGSSLDAAVGALRTCCLEATGPAEALEVLRRGGAAIGSETLLASAKRALAEVDFSAVDRAYTALGLSGNGDRLEFDASGAGMRASIMGGDL